MKVKISSEEIKQIQEMVEKEFPDDPALQEVHFARKVIAREAQSSGQSYFQYIQSQAMAIRKGLKKREHA